MLLRWWQEQKDLRRYALRRSAMSHLLESEDRTKSEAVTYSTPLAAATFLQVSIHLVKRWRMETSV